MVRIRTGSRLHFGLFALPSTENRPWRNLDGEPNLQRRLFGGVGLMIDRPGFEVSAEPAPTWSANGVAHERALRLGQTYCRSVNTDQTFHLEITNASPAHVGLGSGTQLGLAVARAIAELTCQPERDAVTLARHVNRGLRSALGVHGFDHGGFLVEGGKTTESTISPLVIRHDFPEDWQILLITPKNRVGIHGSGEIDAFAEMTRQAPDDRATERLCRLALLGMLPALLERDLAGFGEAVYDFNRQAGEMFAPAQGGPYAHPQIEKLVRALRLAHVRGVGQTSWGPTVFALITSNQALGLCDWLTRKYDVRPEEIVVASALNRGATVGA